MRVGPFVFDQFIMPAKDCSWGEKPKGTSQSVCRAVSRAFHPARQNCECEFFDAIGLDSSVQFAIGDA